MRRPISFWPPLRIVLGFIISYFMPVHDMPVHDMMVRGMMVRGMMVRGNLRHKKLFFPLF